MKQIPSLIFLLVNKRDMIRKKRKGDRVKIGLRTIKTAAGAAIAILIAEHFHLSYAVSAGVITILSVQNTKKKSITLAGQRILSTALALGIAAILFNVIGYNPVAFGLYLLFFIPVAVQLGITDGIVVSSVLVTHLLIEKSTSLHWILNCFGLMLIGLAIAILANLYMPSSEKRLQELQVEIESTMKLVLLDFSGTLKKGGSSQINRSYLEKLTKELEAAIVLARNQYNNQLFGQSYYYIKYFDMRQMQAHVLEQIKDDLSQCQLPTLENEQLAGIFIQTAEKLHEDNPANELMQEIQRLFDHFRNSELPKTRAEFENRAMLFKMLNDFMYFIEIKQVFHREFAPKKEEMKPV